MTKILHQLPFGEIRTCEFCDEGAVSAAHKVTTFLYGEGADAVSLNAIVPVWTCSNCDEEYTDGAAEIARHEAVCRHLGRLTPDDLRKLREARGYSQETWAAFTRIGIASIKRWETGNQIQNAALDQYLRLLADKVVFERASQQSTTSQPEPRFQTKIDVFSLRKASIFELRPEILQEA